MKSLARVSDLNLGDIPHHEGSPRRLIADFSRWIEQNCSHRQIEVSRLVHRFRAVAWLREYMGPDEFDRIPPEGVSAALVGAERKLGIRFGPRT